MDGGTSSKYVFFIPSRMVLAIMKQLLARYGFDKTVTPNL
jgi:hypothetical protein